MIFGAVMESIKIFSFNAKIVLNAINLIKTDRINLIFISL